MRASNLLLLLTVVAPTCNTVFAQAVVGSPQDKRFTVSDFGLAHATPPTRYLRGPNAEGGGQASKAADRISRYVAKILRSIGFEDAANERLYALWEKNKRSGHDVAMKVTLALGQPKKNNPDGLKISHYGGYINYRQKKDPIWMGRKLRAS